MTRWHTNPDGSASLDVPDDVFEGERKMIDEYPEWVCSECGKSLFAGPVFPGKGEIYQPPYATCSPEHAKAQGSKDYANWGER